jgi:hypothetical protein
MSAAALQETQSIQVNRLSAHIGAEIRGVDDRCARFTRCGRRKPDDRTTFLSTCIHHHVRL